MKIQGIPVVLNLEVPKKQETKEFRSVNVQEAIYNPIQSDPERLSQTKSPPSKFIFGPIRTSGDMYARQHPDGPLSHLWVLQASIVGRILRTLHGIIPTAD
jgi:hypothetical protein